MGTLATASRQPFESLLGFVKSSVLGSISLILLALLMFIGLFPQAIAPYGPDELFYVNLKQPPSMDHWAGTDFISRDSLTRIIFGARITLLVAFVSVFIGDAVGFAWGVMSGYLGGKFDMVSQRMVDMFIAFPTIILALLLLAALGSGLFTVILAIAVIRIPGTARVIRSVALSTRATQYVEAAGAVGASQLRIMVRHIAPQCFAPLFVVASAGLGSAIFTEAALSFLGMGVPPSDADMGEYAGRRPERVVSSPPWWLVIFPGVAITITILAFQSSGRRAEGLPRPETQRASELVGQAAVLPQGNRI